MIRLTSDTVYAWLTDYESFAYDFKRTCFVTCQALGLDCRFDEAALKLVHDKWVEACEAWRTEHFPEEADALSHLKVIALLLYHLSLSPYISAVYNHSFGNDLYYSFSGTDEEKLEARDEIVAAREVILALDFCISVAVWYEERRIDRASPFDNRMTRDLRHDIISYLVSRQGDSKGLYLVLKALFIRDSLPH